ncbi:HesA/MoeB/ThiF family protein [Niabella insulamsoli]|uniref:HesA/MoeB/ThiF family protein n=1 Tax=Niabella insulamsoli TaxID=3144874 RepID=UPI0031FC2F35
MVSEVLFDRYSRQIFIDEIGIAGQRKIASAKILVIGAGGLGCPVIQYLAAAGVGTMGVADFDKVELHNLNRQIIHKEQAIGFPKVKSVQQEVGQLNSRVNLIPIEDKVRVDNVTKLISGYDIIIDGSDNFDTRYLVNDACVELRKPLVYGSVLAFEGQLAVFNYKGSKHLRHIFPEMPGAEETLTCDGKGVLGPLPGIVGAMMAMQALKILVGLPVDVNQLTVIDTFHWHFSVVTF